MSYCFVALKFIKVDSLIQEYFSKFSQLRSYLNKKVAAPVQKTEINGRGDRCADHVTPLYPLKLALTSPTGGGHSVGIVRSRTKATEFFSKFCVNVIAKSCISKSTANCYNVAG